MIAINSEHNSFGHVHFDAVLKRNDCSAGAVKIIEALIDRGVEKKATGSGKCDSGFQFCIFWCKLDWWECAQRSLGSRRLTRTFVEKCANITKKKSNKLLRFISPEPAPTVRNCIIVSVVHICVVSGHWFWCLGRLNCRFSTGIFIVKPR
jgi:hypothetical protein